MAEVQCFDGDGVVPPELQALIKENERLQEVISNRDRSIARLEKTVREQEEMIQDYGGKLWQIEGILKAKMPDPTYNDPVNEQMRSWEPELRPEPEPEPEPEWKPSKAPAKKAQKTAEEMFDALMRHEHA